MQLHDLQRNHPNMRKKPRVGRGGKRGTTAGRGTKGQKSRAGRRIRPGERDFIQRLPKLRGYGNKSSGPKPQIVRVGDLHKIGGDSVTHETLRAAGLIYHSGERAKILNDNRPVPRAFTVNGVEVSAGARKKIEAAGGSIHSKRDTK